MNVLYMVVGIMSMWPYKNNLYRFLIFCISHVMSTTYLLLLIYLHYITDLTKGLEMYFSTFFLKLLWFA